MSRFFQKEGFLNEIVGRILLRQLLADVVLGGKQDHRNTRCRGTALELLHELPAVHAGHPVVADQEVGRVVHCFEQGIGSIRGSRNDSQLREGLTQHSKNHWIVVHQQDFDVTRHLARYFPWFCLAF